MYSPVYINNIYYIMYIVHNTYNKRSKICSNERQAIASILKY